MIKQYLMHSINMQFKLVRYFTFIIAILLSITFSYLLRFFYLNYWRSISDKIKFHQIFVLLTLIITIIITVVKSSLALSLGLVGALSIVRFRTPIKDPENNLFIYLHCPRIIFRGFSILVCHNRIYFCNFGNFNKVQI